MRFKHIIWDYDGTLFDTYPVMAAAFRDALSERGIVETTDEIMSFMKVSMREAKTHYTDKYCLDDTFFARFDTLRKRKEIESTMPFDGVVDLCKSIVAQGANNYLFTHRGESAFYYMEKYKLLPLFTEVITAERGFASKPSPEAVLYIMSAHEFQCDDAIIIGDRDIDILSGQNAGIHSCYYSNQGEKSNIAEYCVESITELWGVLGILNIAHVPVLASMTGASI